MLAAVLHHTAQKLNYFAVKCPLKIVSSETLRSVFREIFPKIT